MEAVFSTGCSTEQAPALAVCILRRICRRSTGQIHLTHAHGEWHTQHEVSRILREEVQSGRFDAEVVEVAITAVSDATPRYPTLETMSYTALWQREIEVLHQISLGANNEGSPYARDWRQHRARLCRKCLTQARLQNAGSSYTQGVHGRNALGGRGRGFFAHREFSARKVPIVICQCMSRVDTFVKSARLNLFQLGQVGHHGHSKDDLSRFLPYRSMAMARAVISMGQVHSAEPSNDARHTADRLLRLVDERLAIASDVAKDKWTSGNPIDAPAREVQILDRVVVEARRAGIDETFAQSFFDTSSMPARLSSVGSTIDGSKQDILLSTLRQTLPMIFAPSSTD